MNKTNNYPLFAARLRDLMIAAGFKSPSGSDLTVAIWGQKRDARGYLVANNRDTMWRYLHGYGLPARQNLELLAGGLGVTVDVLVDGTEAAGRIVRAAPQRTAPQSAPGLHEYNERTDGTVSIRLVAPNRATADKIIKLVLSGG